VHLGARLTIALGLAAISAGLAVAAPPAAAKVKPYDFDADGRQELVIMAPGFWGYGGSGVVVLRTDTRGVTASSQIFRGAGDSFGFAVASGDFNGDGYADLAMTAGDPDIEVVYGSPRGLNPRHTSSWDDSERSPETGVVAADFDGNGYDDLAIGLVGTVDNQLLPEMDIVRGGHRGLATRATTTLSADVRDLAVGHLDGDRHPDLAFTYAGDHLGVCPGTARGPVTCSQIPHHGFIDDLVIANVTGDRRREIVASTPGDTFHGAVEVFSVEPGGSIEQLFRVTEATPGIPGRHHRDSPFALSLAAGRLDGDRWDDLALGSPWGEAGGSVTIVHGARHGLALHGNRKLRQSSHGVPGSDEPNDYFGFDLAMLDHDGDGRLDLDVLAASEPHLGEIGRVTVLYDLSRRFQRTDRIGPGNIEGARGLGFWGLGSQ
jgi:hypothetical protein